VKWEQYVKKHFRFHPVKFLYVRGFLPTQKNRPQEVKNEQVKNHTSL